MHTLKTGEMYLATLKMVAKKANVSVMTVSRVLNNPEFVSDKTKERVLRAIRELDYQPNEAARIMKGKRSNILGVLIPDLENPLHCRFMDLLEETVTPLGYRLLIASSSASSSLIENLKYMLSRNVDAIVISSCSGINEASQYIIKSQIDVPLVIIDKVEPEGIINSVYTDGFQGTKQIVDYLVSLGHRKIAMIKGAKGYQITNDRFSGYQAAMQAHGLPIEPAYVYRGDYTIQSGIVAANYFLSLEDPPTAIVAPSDLIAVGAMHAIQAQGYKIPEDFSVTGCDGIYLADLTTPTLTTFMFSIKDVAQKVTDIIINELENQKAESVTAVFEGSLKIGGSTGIPRK